MLLVKDGENLRYYLIVIVLMSTFFSGCNVSFKSRADRIQDQKVIASASACHDEEAKAKILAVEALTEPTSISLLSQDHSLKRIKGDKAFCYEAVLTHKEWSHYLQGLQKQREKIVLYIDEQNNTVLYDEKAMLVQGFLKEKKEFNDELENANMIAPTNILLIDLDQITLETSINAAPSVSIAFIPCNRNSNFNCQLGFISKVQDESKKISYHWDFGNGAISKRKNPLYTYPEAGEYNVTLQVQDTHKVYSSASTKIQVQLSEKPTAMFDIKERSYKTQESVRFKNMSYSQKSKIISYQWSFGDGSRSSKQNPEHAYSKAGSYIVVLKVCNGENYCTSASKKIAVLKRKVLIDAKKGIAIQDYIAENGEASDQIIKKKSLMSAYKYGNIWLLAKRGKIECAVQEKGLSTNLMGQPKKCYWHEKHAKQYMVELE